MKKGRRKGIPKKEKSRNVERSEKKGKERIKE